MRIYHYLPSEYALQNLKFRRLKISLLDSLNDPFELVAADNSKRIQRTIWESWRQEQIKRWGLVCFSKTWANPVLWSHYADRHKGMCLGFEVPEKVIIQVRYTRNRLNIDIEKLHGEGKLSTEHMIKMFKTKFIDWRYEREARIYARLEKKDDETGLFFHEFDDDIKLTDVFAGPLCNVSKSEIHDSLQIEDSSARIIKTRLAFKTFNVVEQKQGF